MLKRRVTESHRFGIPISVMYIKVDEYDAVSRKYGSPIARQLVDTAGPAFQRVLREMDVMAKLENGEFVVMLPGSTFSEVNQVVKRMRVAAGHCALPLADRELKVEFQHGVAELKTGETAQELLARARQAISTEPRAHAGASSDR
jgi:two-component system cell cycle response regulator